MGEKVVRSRLAWVCLTLLLVVSFAAVAALPGTAAAASARYARFDVVLEVREDGSYHVTETQVVEFADGPFRQGYRSIPLARTEGISAVRVSELTDGQLVPYEEAELEDLTQETNRFNVQTWPENVYVRWTFAEVVSGQRTFVVEYDVAGALRVYPDADPPNQQVWWTAVGSDLTEETPVDETRVEVVLPAAVDLNQVQLSVEESNEQSPALLHSTDGKTFTWEESGLADGESFTVRLQVPPVVEGAVPPSWQEADDRQRAEAEQTAERSALIRLLLLGLGALVLAGGGTGVYGLWYMRGRDPHAGLVADFLPAPPDDLPPGVAGALLDERANESDVVATLLDLARRGDVTMTDLGLVGPAKRATGHDYLLKLVRADPNLTPFETRMVRAIFGGTAAVGTEVRLTAVKGEVVRQYPQFKAELYAELVKHGYFTRSPESTRSAWRRRGIWIAVVAAVAGVIGVLVFDWFALIPALAAVAIGLVVSRLGSAMPRKTAAGAEAAARWRAFRRYLEGIERYENLGESRQIFDKYLAFAVAFGIDSSWVAKFAKVETPVPGWFETDGMPGSPFGSGHPTVWTTGSWPSSGGGGMDLPDVDLPGLPDVQQMSNRAGSGLQSGSSGLMQLLSVAGAIMEIASSFSGGGGGGGSSGGGGGGFS